MKLPVIHLPVAVAIFVTGAVFQINVSAETSHATQHPPVTDREGAEAVNIVLTEWAISPDRTTVSAGPVTFKAINGGPSDIHEIAVVRTDRVPDRLPVDANGNVDERSADIEIVGEIEDIAVGESMRATFQLEPGNYVLICNIWEPEERESHYAKGMYVAFKVR